MSLSHLGVPCFEIVLDPYQYESWTWMSLRQEVLESPRNRHWIFHPDAANLAEQARCEAVANAFEKPILAAAAPERIRLRVFGVPVHLLVQVWGLCLWWPYNERVNAMLKAIAKSFGGRYNAAYRNWVIPVGAKSAVLAQLDGIGAIREN
jgi:competence protein CoiA